MRRHIAIRYSHTFHVSVTSNSSLNQIAKADRANVHRYHCWKPFHLLCFLVSYLLSLSVPVIRPGRNDQKIQDGGHCVSCSSVLVPTLLRESHEAFAEKIQNIKHASPSGAFNFGKNLKWQERRARRIRNSYGWSFWDQRSVSTLSFRCCKHNDTRLWRKCGVTYIMQNDTAITSYLSVIDEWTRYVDPCRAQLQTL